MARRWLALWLCWLALLAIPAHASFHLFVIDQVYSNSDGSVQYIVMREASGANGENFWSGNTIATTNSAGVQKSFRFPSNLPSSNTASRSVLIGTAAFGAVSGVAPDYTIPERFIPVDGGSLSYASGTDRINLPALPIDGFSAINRNGTPVPATPRNFSNVSTTMTTLPVTSVEYYNATLDHYFISSLAPDIDALDSGRIAGWARTGKTFLVYASSQVAGPPVTAVCRIIIPPPHGDSHFFGRSAQECNDTLAKFPFMSQETPNAFYVVLPTNGTCPQGNVPVYRVFDNRADANHRYMTDRAVRDAMVSTGWVAEGDGDDLVVMCAPGAIAATTAVTTTDPPVGGDPMNPPPPMYCTPDPYRYGCLP
ncbi:MAG TPA: hypothetical protein VMV45_15785 [Casimicrobiaceae bacterium]|nr:hypothetical protein [Casimicrobiaceae bacterium]